jgi:hypothetical protein
LAHVALGEALPCDAAGIVINADLAPQRQKSELAAFGQLGSFQWPANRES